MEEFQQSPDKTSANSGKNNGIGQKKILIVDDEIELAAMLQEILESEGYKTVTAQNGIEALKIYEQEKKSIGIIISDLGMPLMDGRELIKTLTETGAYVKFIFMTGYLDKESKVQLKELGARDVLLKPFTTEDVLSTISSVARSLHER